MKWKVGFFIVTLFFTCCTAQYNNDEFSIFKYNESAGIATLDPFLQEIKLQFGQLINCLMV
tara:strand:+ start:1443 stop:1625 length:183 start_codon:yes stop_codon:yes gene_type:complete